MTTAVAASLQVASGRYEDVTLVVPTLNEAPNLRAFLANVERALPGCSVVVADDDSRDGTRGLARGYRGDVNMVVLHRTVDRGLTASVADGILHARTPFIVVMDADMQHPADALPALVERLRDGHDLVVATRSNDASFTLRRRLLSRGARALARRHLRACAGVELRDPMSGFFGVRADLAQSIVREHGRAFERAGFKVLLDLLLHAPSDVRVAEVPYVFQARHAGESKLTRRHYVSFLRQLGGAGRLAASVLDALLSGLLLRVALVGATGVLGSEALLYAGVEGAGAPLALATVLAIELGVLWSFAWSESWSSKARAQGALPRRLGRFHAASAAGMACNLAVVLAGAQLLPHVSYLATNLVGIGLAGAVNLLVGLRWAWRPAADETPEPHP